MITMAVEYVEPILMGAGFLLAAVTVMYLDRLRSWVMEKIRKKRYNATLYQTVKSSSKVQEALTRLLANASAGRTFVAQFHNGDRFTVNNPIWRVSWTHEADTAGVMQLLTPSSGERRSSVEGVFAEHMSDLLAPLFDDHKNEELAPGIHMPKTTCERPIVYVVTRDMKAGYMRELLKFQGVEARVLVGLRGQEKNASIWGLLGVDYIDSQYQNPENMPSDEVFTEVCEVAQEIEFLLLSDLGGRKKKQ